MPFCHDGVSEPLSRGVEVKSFRGVVRRFLSRRQLLTQPVRRAANILNKHTILVIVLNLLTT